MTGTESVAWACRPEDSRGRLHDEPESRTRSPFQRDRDRIIHSGAFRRLKHKTQVFIYHEGDYYRSRLTHTIEVAQIARSVARALGLNEDLAEAIALAHDMGHTPFAHAGEIAMRELMEPWGGFEHNDQTLRVLTLLEHRYAAFDGLNLTWETLEGVVKHNGPVMPDGGADDLPFTLRNFSRQMDLAVDGHASAEAQVAAIADDVAYNNHDMDDGLRAGLFGIDDLRGLPLVGDIIRRVEGKYPNLEKGRLHHEVNRRLIDAMVNDLLSETGRRISALAPASVDDIRGAGHAVVGFSDEMKECDAELRAFLFRRMYRHYQVNRTWHKCQDVVRALFRGFLQRPDTLPREWQTGIAQVPEGMQPQAWAARVVADYIAGMTDRYAMEEHRRLYDVYERVF